MRNGRHWSLCSRDRAQLLFELATEAFALGQKEEGQDVAGRLIKEHPDTGVAARAKARGR
jgi:hypothetical protein